MDRLVITQGNIEELYNLPNVHELRVTVKDISSWPKLPDSIYYLDIIDCENITCLPELPPKLIVFKFRCGCSPITTLPELPPTLEELYCHGNQLTTLPELPNTLKELLCHSNQLTTLPELPPTLKKLICGNNQLTTLPELPLTLEHLDCVYNNLTTLPNLPKTLKVLLFDERIHEYYGLLPNKTIKNIKKVNRQNAKEFQQGYVLK